MLKKLKRSFLRQIGYQKIEHWHKFSHAFEAQEKLLEGKKVQTIFDVGGNVGQTAKTYRRHFQEATVHSFEPFPDSFHELSLRCNHDPFVKPYQIALSDQKGISEFYVNACSATNSLFPNAETGAQWCPPNLIKPISTINVETTTIDHFCQKHAIEHLHILKMDTQGGELKILKGAKEMLEKKMIDLIYTEVLFVPLYSGQANFYQISSYLTDFRYRLFDFFSYRYAENGQLKWADAIFIPF